MHDRSLVLRNLCQGLDTSSVTAIVAAVVLMVWPSIHHFSSLLNSLVEGLNLPWLPERQTMAAMVVVLQTFYSGQNWRQTEA